MNQFFKIPNYFHNPLFRYIITYAVVFSAIFWANSIFMHYRVVGNIIFTIMPIVGTVIMYLWIILLADEFLDLLGRYKLIASIIKKLKIGGFIIIVFYGMIAFALWMNRISYEPTIRKSTKIVSISDVDIGTGNYERITVKSWDNDNGNQNILMTYDEQFELYAGMDIEILMRKGILSLYRVLEVGRDMENYYINMLKAAPDSKVAIEKLVSIYSKRNEFEKALKWFDELYVKFPDIYTTGHDLGGSLIESGRYTQAVGVLKKVLETTKDYELLYMTGYALAWAGKKYEAEKYLIEATELDSTDFRAFYSLGYVYRDTGRNAKAKEAWTKVLELLPDFPEVKNNLKSIEK
jgi:tetratricopeptide (TPR) repeat protein